MCIIRGVGLALKRPFRSKARVLCIGNRCHNSSSVKELVRSFGYADTRSVGFSLVTRQAHCLGRGPAKINDVYGTVRRLEIRDCTRKGTRNMRVNGVRRTGGATLELDQGKGSMRRVTSLLNCSISAMDD